MHKRIAGIGLVSLLVAALVPAPAAQAVQCEDPQLVAGRGIQQFEPISRDEVMPLHTEDCPGAVGTVTYAVRTQDDAIAALETRDAHSLGLAQPLDAVRRVAMSEARKSPRGVTDVMHLPMVLQGFVVTTNVPSTCSAPPRGVRFTPLTLSLVFSGDIEHWGDPRLAASQATTDLTGCDEPIRVSARGGAGAEWSNAVLKDYLSRQNPAFATYRQPDRVNDFPPELAVACTGTTDDGMAACGANSGSISYMPYRTAKTAGLGVAQLANGSGEFVPPAANAMDESPTNCTAAVPEPGPDTHDPTRAEVLPPVWADWSTFSLTYGRRGYAMCGFAYVIALRGFPDGWSIAQVKNVQDHLETMASDTVQAALVADGHAPIPPSTHTVVQSALATMSG